MSDLSHRAFVGDAERTFRLTDATVRELERVTGAGIGALVKRILAAEFRQGDLTETIRLGLVGAGTDPKEAASLVATYVVDRPVNDAYGLAVAILMALWSGATPAVPSETA